MKNNNNQLAIIAIVAALGVLGVVVVTVAVTIQLLEAEAVKPPNTGTGCKSSQAFNASKGRCFHP